MGTSSSGCMGMVTFAAIISLIFALIWTVLAILGFMLKTCSIKLDSGNPASILVLVYFYDNCNYPSWALEQHEGSLPTRSSRTTGVLWWYAVSGCVRVVASVIALVVMVIYRGGRKEGTPRPSPFLWLWAAVSVAGLIGDLVCAILYGIDFGHTSSMEDLSGIPINLDSVREAIMALKFLPMLMMLFCSRFIIFWIIELCLVILSIRSLTVQQQKSKLPKLDEFEPWQSRMTNVKGVDKPRAGAAPGRSEGSPNMRDSHLYNEPFQISGSAMQGPAGQDVQDNGAGEFGLNGAYMANPVPGVGPYQLQVPSDGYAQPWAGGRPKRTPPPPPLATGAGRQQHANNFESPSPDGRLGDWDPRSPMPSNNQQTFFSGGGPQPQHQPWQQQQQRPSALTSFQHQQAGEDSSRNSRLGPGVRRTDSREATRYIEKLRDVEAERLAKEEEKKERRRQKEEERREQEKLYADAALQQVTAIASAMEESRRRKRGEEGGSSDARPKKGPPPAPPRRPPPVGLQNQTPWSYVLPALDNPTVLPMQNRRDDDDDEDAPSVPVPDYTIHIKRHKDRPTIDVN